MTERILVIDEGTTSTRAILFDATGACLGSEQHPLTQSYPAPGLVEHDAGEIWTRTLAATRAMVTQAGGADRVAAIGITNQRETIVFWDRRTGEPLAPAIVWQDRRTAAACAALREAGHEPLIQDRTGLLLDPYFSASKIAWALDHGPALRAAGDRLAVGTVESYLLFRLTGGVHCTDATNAARTALMRLDEVRWDDALCALFGVPMAILPEIVDCAGPIGHTDPALFGGVIPITGMAGDQQAATIGQACLTPGQTKATFGTGAFVLTNTGERIARSTSRLLATLLCRIGGTSHYALEGSVFVAGSLLGWLVDDLGLFASAAEVARLAGEVADTGGVYLVPALAGLGAPHWAPGARGAITGLSFATGRAQLARAAMEAMAYQAHDLMRAFAADGAHWGELRLDGGMATGDWLAQDLADMLAVPVERPDFTETTALGAAMLAAVGAGLHANLADAAAMRGAVRRYVPQLDGATRDARLAGWGDALATLLRGARAR